MADVEQGAERQGADLERGAKITLSVTGIRARARRKLEDKDPSVRATVAEHVEKLDRNRDGDRTLHTNRIGLTSTPRSTNMEAKHHRRYKWREINNATILFFLLLLFVTFIASYTSDYVVENENEIENDSPKSPFESWTSPYLFDCRSVFMSGEDSGEFVKTALHPSFEMNIHSPEEDKFLSGSIKKSGWWEFPHTKWMLRTFEKYPDAYLLDIGGNIGCMTLAAANANQQTITLEPFAPNYERLCRSVNKNSFHDRIHLVNAAASDKPETMLPNLKEATANMGGVKVSSLTDESAKHDRNGVLKGIPIDSLNLPTGIPVVMKLDVEGHELSALVGALGFLEKADLVMAMMELRQPLDKDPRWTTIFRIMHSKGLQPYKLSQANWFMKLDANNTSSWSSHQTNFDVVWANESPSGMKEMK